jgi:hypothetical protein
MLELQKKTRQKSIVNIKILFSSFKNESMSMIYRKLYFI